MMKFVIDEAQITFDDLIALEEGHLKSLKKIMARSLIDERGERIAPEKAEERLGQLTMAELTEALRAFTEAIDAWKGKVLPKEIET